MGVEFILDEKLKRSQEDLDKAISILSKKEDKTSIFLRRFWFACLKAVEAEIRKESLKEKIDLVSKLRVNRMLPIPPRPVTKMVVVGEGDLV
ncbi:MAG TPA: hypothetical protein VJJ53_00665 [Candidatus Nanoarchaeia archaeon]|nr:hypothetical protein [Candidatus Nanoarchaeia archaeon]